MDLAENGNSALALRSRHFDLIITDLIMPEKKGSKRSPISGEFGNVPIIAISGGGRGGPMNYSRRRATSVRIERSISPSRAGS